MINELPYNLLRTECDENLFDFNSTSEISPLTGIIGQERAVRAMEFGLKVKIRGYNIFIAGLTGTGKTSYAEDYIKKIALNEPTPDDWCYVYNFDNYNQPIALNMPAGIGKVFQKDMEEFINVLKLEIQKAFDSDEYEKEKSEIVKGFQERKDKLVEILNEDAQKQGFKVRTSNTGIFFMPIIEGKAISEDEFSELDEDIRFELSKKSNIIQLETVEIIRKIKNVEKEAEEKIREWENKIALFAVGMHVNDMKEKYKDSEKISDYLEKLQSNILENLDDFKEHEPLDENAQIFMPWVMKTMESPTDKYTVNVLVDNSDLKGAPVIVDFNPTYYNLLGKYEYENEFGSMTTNFKMIKSGLFHQANGGFLILQVKDVLSNTQTWEALKRVLRTKKILVGNIKEQMSYVPVSTLKPDPIPLNVKVVLVGNVHIYQMLLEVDEDFKKLFKIKVEFDELMDKSPENIKKLAQFISSFCEREKTIHFDRSGVARVVDYCSRLIEDQRKMSTKFNDIVEILSESCAWAQIDNCEQVSAKHVKTAIKEKIYRCSSYDEKLKDLLNDGAILIDTTNEVVGQINGLSIIDIGDISFGKPARITATTYIGESGIVNIEREIELSGTSHTKGVLILSGYIGQKFAQDIPLSLSASLCFEQLYSGIDGDSASSAELYAILSSLSEVPIKQYIAVTGSVNQKGEIQAVGGVTEKIEGFFSLCKHRGLDGKHGVIIPKQNINNLVLNDEVVQAVKDGMFHIYPVSFIDEGIKILTGIDAGELKKEGTFPKGTINSMVFEKLRKYAMKVLAFSKE